MNQFVKRETEVVIGNRTFDLGSNQCEWKFFVENYDNAISKVEVFLHPTFNPNRLILTARPFEFERVGWGAFELKLKIHFIDGQVLPFQHNLVFSEEPVMKQYTITVDGLRRKHVPPAPIDSPILMTPLKRKMYYLNLERIEWERKKEEEREQKKAENFEKLIGLQYDLYGKSGSRGHPEKVRKLLISDGVMKWEKYSAICGVKEDHQKVAKAMNGEFQRKVLEFVRKELKDLPVDQRVEEQEGRRRKFAMKYKINFKFSGGGVSLERRLMNHDQDAHKRVSKVVDFVESLM